MNCILTINPTKPCNVTTRVYYGSRSRVLWMRSLYNEELIDFGVLCAGDTVNSLWTEHDGKWYNLRFVGTTQRVESTQQLYELIQSGLEPYRVFEILAL